MHICLWCPQDTPRGRLLLKDDVRRIIDGTIFYACVQGVLLSDTSPAPPEGSFGAARVSHKGVVLVRGGEPPANSTSFATISPPQLCPGTHFLLCPLLSVARKLKARCLTWLPRAHNVQHPDPSLPLAAMVEANCMREFTGSTHASARKMHCLAALPLPQRGARGGGGPTAHAPAARRHGATQAGGGHARRRRGAQDRLS